jgi:hypothetical protein
VASDLGPIGHQLRNLIDSIVLGSSQDADEVVLSFRNPAFAFIEETFRAAELSDRDRRQRLRLRLALHLAPPNAIDYSPSNPVPRWMLIEQHLVSNLNRSASEVTFLAKEVAATLKSWQEDRQAVNQFRDALLAINGDLCRCCRVEFGASSAMSVVTSDPYKPYYAKDPSSPMNRATVDHIVPVSGFGSNDMDNLQLLCELCNKGKGALEPPLLKHEALYAARPIGEIPWWHRAKLLYFTLEAYSFSCSSCGADTSELTIRKIVTKGAIVSTNLRSACYICEKSGADDH